MNDDRDVFAHDQVLLAEIDLLTELVIAATNSAERLQQDRIDTILGVKAAVADDCAEDLLNVPRQRRNVAARDQEPASS